MNTFKTQTMAVLAALLLLAGSGPALAEKGDKYFAVDYNNFSFDLLGQELNPKAIAGTFGGYLHDNIAIEGRLGFGIQDDTIFGAEVEISNYQLINVRADFYAGENFRPYAVLGYGRVEAEARGFGGSAKASENDFAYGLGFEAKGEKIGVRFEYIRLNDEDNAELDTLNVGLTVHF